MKRTGKLKFWAVTIFLMLVTAFCCAGTAFGRVGADGSKQEAYYRAKENWLVCEARAFLNGEGFENGGVMLTHVTEADGSRFYTLTVHHSGIGRLCEEDRQDFLARLEELVFEDPACAFSHKILLDD